MAIGAAMGGGGGHGGLIAPLIVVAVGVLVLAVIYTLGPTILAPIYQASSSANSGISTTNPWNATNTSNGLSNGVSIWNNTTLFSGIVVLVILAMMVLGYLMIIT